VNAPVIPERHTGYRWGYIGAGSLVALVGAALLAAALGQAGALARAAVEIALLAFGWGPLVSLLGGVGGALSQLGRSHSIAFAQMPLFAAGAMFWTIGWALIALGIRRLPSSGGQPSEASGAPLYPPLARYADFYWGTLLAYGGGILLSELILVLLHTALVGGMGFGAGGHPTAASRWGIGNGVFRASPVSAFSISLLVACAVGFAAGFAGASRARRLSVPEATVGILYFGLPIPIALTLLSTQPALQLRFGYRLREVTYVASLIGRPELGYWLVFVGLALMVTLGITAGFVATGSGKVDLRAGFELFVARRHAAVFRPRLLLGLLVVLLLGIVPPLIVYAMIRAAEAAVERTRIRSLGMLDPLKASEALERVRTDDHSPTAMMTALSVGGVGVGVMALIIVLSVMSGFEVDLQEKILGTNAHIMVSKYSDSFTEYPEVMEKIRRVKGVIGMTPFVYGEVMLTSDRDISGTVIKGIDPATVGDVTDLKKNIETGGSLENLSHPEKISSRRFMGEGIGAGPPSPGRADAGLQGASADDGVIERAPDREGDRVLPGIIIGRGMSDKLRLYVGDRVNMVSPLGGELGPQGPIPKSRPFRVAGIFYSGMYEYDLKFAYIELHEAEKFFNVQGITGIDIKVADIDDARRIAAAILEELDGYPYRAKDWGEMNRNLFSALRLEKLVMGIILTIIIIVAAGLIIATVIMLVLEKRKEIAVLKALGVPDGGIVKIFLAEGLQIGLAGGLLGLFSGIAWCLFIEKVGIKLDAQVYYIPALPVRIEPLQTAISVVIAILATYLASVYPALKAAQVQPVEGLKSE
jgi:lipoprotein-releasing system permease protein